jgi:endonuclease YncB( thermonuclease family)
MTTTAADLYRYAATITRIIDGDTFKADVDLGCHVHWRGSLRTAGYNAPEVRGSTALAGAAATAYVEQLCPVGSTVYLDSLAFQHGDEEDDFGRLLGAVTLSDGRDLAQLMIGSGHAVVDPAQQNR